jgi:predicted phage baseplate assembly protein
MPLPLPSLDKRTWSDLVSEARTLLPRYAPGWTDYNVHDPGVTLVELFAWLSEMLMFRADRVPPAEVRAFLRWFGVIPRPAQPAATALALRLPPGGSGVLLPGGLKVEDPTSAVVFEAPDVAFVSPAWIELSLAEGTSRGQIWSQSAGAFTDLSADNCRRGFDFLPLGAAPAPGDALWLGFDCSPGAVGQVLNLWVWTATWGTDAAVIEALEAQAADREPCPQPVPSFDSRDDCLDGNPVPPAAPDPRPGPFDHYSARVAWEGWDGATWQPLGVVTDQTRALTLSGPVQLDLTASLQPDPPQAPSAGRWWLRCRLVGGGFDCSPLLAGVAANAVAASHAASVTGPEVLGVSEGHADEVFYLQGRVAEQGPCATAQPVLADTLKLRLTGGGPPDDGWTEVPNWDRTGPFDRHYVLDPADDSLHLGNGVYGRVAPADWTLEALEYRVGGGPAGNLPVGRLTEILSGGAPGLEAEQPFAALGGAPPETLDQAHGRLLAHLAEPSRGITVADWVTLALQVPGVPVARAAAIPGYLPELCCWSAPGVVTVVVAPGCGRPPVPSRGMIAAVERSLDPARPVTTELHVVGPAYVPVTVTATLHTAAPDPALPAAAQAALDAFFDPITGGPDGTGWPFGRGILKTDLLDILAGLGGVRYVDGLGISAGDQTARCDNITLCPTDLVASQAHHFTVVEG